MLKSIQSYTNPMKTLAYFALGPMGDLRIRGVHSKLRLGNDNGHGH